MNNIDSKRKLNFIKSFWMEMLEVNVYRYERNKLSNLNTYFIEVTNLITSIKKEHKNKIKKSTFGLHYLLSEFQFYLNQNIYFIKEYNNDNSIGLLIQELNKIIKAKDSQDVKSQILNVELLLNKIKYFQKENIRKLFNELLKYIYGPLSLEESYIIAKSLTMDLLVELILDGYPIEYLKKETYKEYFYNSQFQENQPQSLKQQFENTRELLVENDKKRKHTFIFRINNLKTISPFKIQEFLFYNPSREDINIPQKNLRTLFEEEGLMKREEVENKNLSSDSINRVHEYTDMRNHTDAHVRVEVTSWSKEKAKLEVVDRLNNILMSIRMSFNISDLSISHNHVYVSRGRKQYPLFRIDKEDAAGTDYSRLTALRGKIEYLEDRSSKFYEVLTSIQNNKAIHRSLKSFHLGKDTPSLINKFHNYWIALESLLNDEESGKIKARLLKTYPEFLVYYYYYFELVDISDEIFKDFYKNHYNGYKIRFPAEINEIKDLGNFHQNLNLKVLSENLILFPKYLKDEYLIYRINNFNELNENRFYRKTFNEELELSYRQKLSKIYALRNQMFHDAENDNSMLIFYTDWLESLLYSVFGTVQNNIYKGVSSNSYLKIKYKEFINYVNQSEDHIIKCYETFE